MQITVNKQNVKNKLCLFLTFSIIFLTSSLVVTSDIVSSTITVAWWLLCAALLLMTNKSINKSLFICTVALVVIVFLSTVFNGENIMNQLKILFSFFVILLYISSYDYNQIIKAFSDVLLFITLIALPLFFICQAMPSFFNSYIMLGPQNKYYYVLYIFCQSVDSLRLGGLFWEPGAYTTFLNIALLLELLGLTGEKKAPLRIFTITVLLIANFLTFSTTGYISTAILLVIYLFAKSRSKLQKFFIILLIVVIIANIFSAYSDQLFGDGTRQTFGKLEAIFDGSAFEDGRQNSASVRVYSIIKPLEIFLKKPLFGVGVTNLAEQTEYYTKGAITCTFVNWFAIYGIFYGIIMMTGYMKLVGASNRNVFIKALIFVFLMACIVSENYAANACFVGIALLGFKRSDDKKYDMRKIDEKHQGIQKQNGAE